MRRLTCLTFAVALLSLPALAADKEQRAPRFDLFDRLVVAFVDLFEKAAGCVEPIGYCQPATRDGATEDRRGERSFASATSVAEKSPDSISRP